MQVEKLSGNPKPLDILAKINQIIDNMVVSVNGSGADGNGNINIATIPVGFNYVQYPGESAPADIFGGTWENISAQFAGMFFRAEGGNAAAFGEAQSQGLPNHTHRLTATGSDLYTRYGANYIYTTAQVQNSVNGMINGITAVSDNNIYGSSVEVRPYNSTIRIWKRTA